MSQIRATATLRAEVEVYFEDDGKTDLIDQAHSALEDEHGGASHDGRPEFLYINVKRQEAAPHEKS